MPSPILIRADRKNIAPRVIAAGDPERTEQLASLLKESRIVNTNRGYNTYSGRYNGKSITVATHGIGGPSAAIVFDELHMLGARSIVRLGTAGAMTSQLKRGDLIIPTGAAHPSGSMLSYVSDGVLPCVPDFDLLSRIVAESRIANARYLTGTVFSTDAFYAENPNFVKKWASRGIVGIDMECATLFLLGSLRRFASAAVLIVSDSLVAKDQKEMFGAKELETFVRKAGNIVLNGLTADQRQKLAAE